MKHVSPPLPPGTKQVLLGFPDTARSRSRDQENRSCVGIQRPFLPKGLLIFGATSDTYVHRIAIGAQCEVEISGERIPGRYFETGKTFAELEALASQGEIEGAVHPRQVFEMVEAQPGYNITVHTSGPYESLCLWGLTYAGGSPVRHVVVEQEPGDPALARVGVHARSWQGRVIEHGLGGERLLVSVQGPSPEIVAQLLGFCPVRY